MTEATEITARKHPWVGSIPLDGAYPLFGRQTALSNVTNLLITERVVLLYAPSAAGKSSFLQAGSELGAERAEQMGLAARMKRKDFQVMKVARVNRLSNGTTEGVGVNSYSRSIRSDIARDKDNVAQYEESLSACLARCCQRYRNVTLESGRQVERPLSWLLIVDQFEEVLTEELADWNDKEEFFCQLGEAMREQDHVWFLLVIQEEYVPALDPFLGWLPDRLSARYRLNLFDQEKAKEVIVQNDRWGTGGQGRFRPEVVEKIVDDLARTGAGHDRRSKIAGRPTHYVEPMHLQIYCKALWEKVSGDRAIGGEELRSIGTLHDALVERVDGVVGELASHHSAQTPERKIRHWLGDNLVHVGLYRRQASRESAESSLGKDVVKGLEDSRLIANDDRRGTRWLELSHDRLVAALLESNERWFSSRRKQYVESIRETMVRLVEQTGLKCNAERRLREWMDTALIDQGRMRRRVERRQAISQIGKPVLEQLERLELVRAVESSEGSFIELSYERLVQAIREINKEWYALNLHQFQLQAKAWHEQGRPAELLASGAMLRTFGGWKPCEDYERRFLEESWAKEKKFRRKITLGFIFVVLVLVIGVGWIQEYLKGQIREEKSRELTDVNIALVAREDELIQTNSDLLTSQNELTAANRDKDAAMDKLRRESVSRLDATAQSLSGRARDVLELDANDELAALLARQGLNFALRKEAVNPPPLASLDRVLRLVVDRPFFRRIVQVDNHGAGTAVISVDGRVFVRSVEGGLIGVFPSEPGDVASPITVDIGGATPQVVAMGPERVDLAIATDDKVFFWWPLNRKDPGKPNLEVDLPLTNAIEFSPDGKVAIAVTEEGRARVFDRRSEQRFFDYEDGAVRPASPRAWVGVAVHPEPEPLRFGIAARSGSVLELRLEAGANHLKKDRQLFAPADITISALTYSSSGDRLAAVGRAGKPPNVSGALIVWDPQIWGNRGRRIDPRGGESQPWTAVAFEDKDAAAPLVITGGEEGGLGVWRMPALESWKGNAVKLKSSRDLTLLNGHRSTIKAVKIDSEARVLISLDALASMREWIRIDRPKQALYGWQIANYPYALAYDSLTEVFLTGSNTDGVRFFQADQGYVEITETGGDSPERPWPAVSYGVHALAIDSTGRHLAVSHAGDKSISVYCLPPLTCSANKGIHRGDVWGLAFSPHGSWLVSGGTDSRLLLWDVETFLAEGASYTPKSLDRQREPLKSVAFGNRYIAAGGDDKLIEIWDPAKPSEPVATLAGHRGTVTSLSMHPKLNVLASGSEDGTVRLWNLDKLAPMGSPLVGHQGPVRTVAIDPSGEYLASGGNDGIVRVWHLDDWLKEKPARHPSEPLILSGHERTVFSVEFSADGRHIVAGSKPDNSGKGNLLVWRTKTEDVAADVCGARFAARNLTCDEWARFVGDIDYQRTCPELPPPPDPENCPESESEGTFDGSQFGEPDRAFR